MLRGRKGFTLIELLVVIAIIGILAAMVFPVFARARESARKAVCLSNVKNIALAFQMYFADNNDTYPPGEHRREAIEYAQTVPGGREGRSYTIGDMNDRCNHDRHMNPFLTYPVILDEYIKNRDVWNCPSAKMEENAQWIVPNIGPGGYLGYLQATEGSWGRNDDVRCGGGPCCTAWPPGWGGDVTDSILQGRADENTKGVFRQSIGYAVNTDMKLVAIDDLVNWVVCADAGAQESVWMASLIVFPDICCSGCGPTGGGAGCCAGDWENCPWTQDCAPDYTMKPGLFGNQYAMSNYTRHLGGSNLGFADGHAAWWHAQRIVAESPTYDDNDAGTLRGIGCIIEACDY
jgi:prepilin-type N-terminal cleavage/methylation domain-containing protein/prepilin-type processing-associated H-X9-DG protein